MVFGGDTGIGWQGAIQLSPAHPPVVWHSLLAQIPSRPPHLLLHRIHRLEQSVSILLMGARVVRHTAFDGLRADAYEVHHLATRLLIHSFSLIFMIFLSF